MTKTNLQRRELLATGLPLAMIELILRLDEEGDIGPELSVEVDRVFLQDAPAQRCHSDLRRHGFQETAGMSWVWEKPKHRRFVLMGHQGPHKAKVVAEGVQFSDGTAVVNWQGPGAHMAVWPSLSLVLKGALVEAQQGMDAAITSITVDWEV